MIYQDQPETLVTRADFEHANNENKRAGIGTLNSHAEYWRKVAGQTAASNRALLEQIEALQARIAELEAAAQR